MTASNARLQDDVMLTRLVSARLNHLTAALDAGARFACMNRGYAAPSVDSSARTMHERLLREIIGDTPLDARPIPDAGCGRGGTLAAIAAKHSPAGLISIDVLDDGDWAMLAACLRDNGFMLDSSRDLRAGLLAAATCRQARYQGRAQIFLHKSRLDVQAMLRTQAVAIDGDSA